MKKYELLKELLINDRSIRRFNEAKTIGQDTLLKIVELTRYCASGRNLQPLRYRLVTDPKEKEELFPMLGWAGYLPEWAGPEEGERPSAYIIQCRDNDLTNNIMCDDGLQLQTLTLGATALGLGGCIIKSFNPRKLSEILKLENRYEPLYVLALGYPVEKVVLTGLNPEKDKEIKYYRDENGVHYVPKRPLEDLIIK